MTKRFLRGVQTGGIGLMLAVLMCVAFCGMGVGQDVKTNSMPGTDFTKFHTYKWVVVEGAKYPNQIVDTQIKNAIDPQLTAKGLTKTDATTADLYVCYQVSVQQQQQWNAYGMGGGIRWGGGMVTADSTTIKTGTLVLDMYDPTQKKLVWTGSATKTLNPSNDQDKNQKNLNKAMQKLLKDYPPKAKS
ncbi:DUF4136 domain-containing protein [Terracidiphilus gabretensis]|uniref:DUF4136 domain-containing protein n=1 Tax=Terracidiphilus gabretensis TaxID=1577687 RepID=UPI001E3C4DEF|nr:DUF4136 domain-containing protein [Terracidiphilus gabretensis]